MHLLDCSICANLEHDVMLEGPHSREEADCICARVGCLARHELDEIVFVKRQVGVDELVELDRADAHW
ncbi:MAG: hypothetical protein ACK56F_05830, partial [bacterium]